MIGKIILAITGIGAGFIISAGVFALITSTGIITRFADKTHTAKSIQLYETIVIAGGILWNIFWIMESHFKFTGQPAKIFQGIMGLCQGIFVGCLAVALAEALNGTAIFARRAKLQMGLSFIVLSFVHSKVLSSSFVTTSAGLNIAPRCFFVSGCWQPSRKY
jgi:stage V sporulation protein AB